MLGESTDSMQEGQRDYHTFRPHSNSRANHLLNEEGCLDESSEANSTCTSYGPINASTDITLTQPLLLSKDDHKFLNKEDINIAAATTTLLPSARPNFSKYEPTILILLCNVIATIVNCLIRYLTHDRDLDSSFIACFRGFVQFLMVSTIILAVGTRNVIRPQTRKEKILLSIRGLLSGFGINLRYAAFYRLPVGIATSLFSTTPVFSSILAWVFLGQELTPIDIASVVLSTIGAAMIGLANPDPGETVGLKDIHVEGVLLALLSALVSSTVFVVLKCMGTSVHFLLSCDISGFFFMVGGFVALAIQGGGVFQATGNIHDTFDRADEKLILWLIAAAVLGALAALCINRGSQLLAPGRTGVLRTSEIPMNFVLAFLVLGEFPSSLIILSGCFLIVMSTVLTAVKGAS